MKPSFTVKNIYFGSYRLCKEISQSGTPRTRYWLFKKFAKSPIGGVHYNNEEVYDLWINRNYRRKGLARKLMEEIIKDYGDGYLSIEADGDGEVTNAQLRCFYRSLGFKSPQQYHNLMYREGNKQDEKD